MPHLVQALTVFALGCGLIHAGRAYARETTVLLSATALLLGLTVGGLVCERLGLPSGSAEAGQLYWPHPALPAGAQESRVR